MHLLEFHPIRILARFGFPRVRTETRLFPPRIGVIFWHHRLAHAAGFNRTDRIRHAILSEYRPTDIDKILREVQGIL